jgi:energy-coupling factor transport system permease protein
VMAIATPAVVLFRDVDATAFADALSQKLRLPERFVVGALAGVRLVQVLGHDLTIVRMTRRSRGLGDRRKWIGVAGEVFSLVVIALRRARVLATAMEARAFGRGPHRTHYRVSRWSSIDAVIVTVALCIVLLALASALLSGTWSP